MPNSVRDQCFHASITIASHSPDSIGLVAAIHADGRGFHPSQERALDESNEDADADADAKDAQWKATCETVERVIGEPFAHIDAYCSSSLVLVQAPSMALPLLFPFRRSTQTLEADELTGEYSHGKGGDESY